MEKSAKSNEGFKMESASEICADIKQDFTEQDPDAKAALVGGRMIKKMIERKTTEQ